MTVREMHYDFKQKLNKIDSQKYNDLYVPEIDWKLNEAQEMFVKMIAQPRISKFFGFETSQRTIDDIRTIVVDQTKSQGVTAASYDNTSYIVTLPNDYWFYSKSVVYAKKGTCDEVRIKRIIPVQHDDEHEESPFNVSSFEWREVNVRFNKDGLRVFTDGTFTITTVAFEYLKRPRLIYNAADWLQGSGTYNTLNGVALTGRQDCELPEGVHRDIVDLAVAITTADILASNYSVKKEKLQMDQLPA